MAKYSEGYQRQVSDKKKLIILISSIVALVALVILGVFLFNKFAKKSTKSLSDKAYQEYFLTDYTKLLKQEKSNGGNYIIYVCSTDSSAEDHNLSYVLAYLDKQVKGETEMKLFLLDYSKFDADSDDTEKSNATKVEASLGFKPSGIGNLIYVNDNDIVNKSTQVLTKEADVQKALKNIQKTGRWE